MGERLNVKSWIFHYKVKLHSTHSATNPKRTNEAHRVSPLLHSSYLWNVIYGWAGGYMIFFSSSTLRNMSVSRCVVGLKRIRRVTILLHVTSVAL